ncbi:MAG: type 11 methyltransferase [Parcubacteria group bacterium]|nr:type 11 methyltransferase [Parcubacteria group bacterium]
MKQLLAVVRENLKEGGSVLELGCGNGHLSRAIAEEVKGVGKMVAIDFYNQPEELPEKVKFIKQDLENLQMDEKFDLVILNQVFEHIKNPLGLLFTIKSILNQHGRIMIVTPNRNGFGNEARVWLPEHGKHYFLWDQESLQFSLERLGFVCRFYNMYIAGSHQGILKYAPMLLRLQNPNLTCIAMLDE